MPYIPKIWREPIAGFDPWKNPGDSKFDLKTAKRICKFIESHCRHSKGQFARQLFYLEPWEKKLFGHLFAWKRPDGKRRFRKLFLYIPRKNGKSMIASVLLILLMKYDGEVGADVYCCAAAKSQAKFVYDPAQNMIALDDELKRGVKTYKSTKTMEYIDETGMIIGMAQVLGSDGDLILGSNPHGYIIDEVLAQKKFDIMENLESGVGTRQQPLGIYLTTAAEDGYNPCNIKLEYAKLVRDGHNDPTYFPVIFETRPNANWHDEKVWAAVNPNLDVTITLDYLRSEYVAALKNKADEIKFKRRYLNMQVAAIDAWIPMDDWNNCPMDMKPEDLMKEKCYLGIDLSSTNDISAVIQYFPVQEACLCHFYCPEAAFQNKIEYGALFKDWMKIMPGATVDYELIYNDIVCLSEQYEIMGIGFDPWHAKDLCKKLSEKFGEDKMIQIGQSAKVMTDPIKQLDAQIRKKALRHFMNPVLQWMAGNAKLWTDQAGKACRVTKSHKDSPAKIDGIIALIMAKAVADEIKIETQIEGLTII
jgi:phage terminase large subunit-like protein